MRTSSVLKTAFRPPSAAARAVEPPLPLVGGSEAARRARAALAVAAARRMPVLLLAEAGCCPDAIVDFLHGRQRPRGPAVAIDSRAADPADIDRRLFGVPSRKVVAHDLEALGRGSAILQAGTGTLFLQNVDELPASAQRRLARLLRDGEAHVASRQHTVVLPFRLVASTSRDLETEVREGRFRADLLRRFAACRITIPPLRHRPGDMAAIIDRLVRDAGAAPRTFTQPALTVLSALPWTHNIDELSSVLDKVLPGAAAIVTQEDVLAHVPIDGAFTRWDLTASLREARRRFERDYIAAVLERHQWRMSDAARALGVERANLYRKTRQLGIVRIARAAVS
jgi:two-component system, NtrC family, nitrogen regulation response regulator NtrX